MADSVPRTMLTIPRLVSHFSELGIHQGMTLVVHSSLSRLGWVCGGGVAVIDAPQQVLGADGHLLMPTHTPDLSDPANWVNPPVPQTWWQEIRETMPPFEAAVTPSSGMGVVPETFRCRPGVCRSNHPQTSFAAAGPEAAWFTADHCLQDGLGEQSPLARVYERDGWVLLLGVGHERNTSFHLGERRGLADRLPIVQNGAPLMVEGRREWVPFAEVELDNEDFAALGEKFEAGATSLRTAKVGQGIARLMRQREGVDFATAELPAMRSA